MLGPSGSGKTTTLRMIAGFELPDSGAVELGGVDVGNLPPYDREVNTVFQDYALFPHMTVGENVEYGMRVKRVDKGERARRRDEALEMVRLTGYSDRKPGELSGGQRQRVALARSIVNRPRVLLLDEPLGALDLKLREQMQVELKQIQHEVGITFVYVTHDQEEALTMSDRIAVFNEGRIEQVGTPAEVYEAPATPFVSGFVGVSNVLERDGAMFTVRPEKVRILECGRAGGRPATRSPADPRRRLRRDDHPLLRRARRGWRDSSRPPEPRDDLRGGARADRAGRGRRMATGTHGRGFVRESERRKLMRKTGGNSARTAPGSSWPGCSCSCSRSPRAAESDDRTRPRARRPTEVGEGEGELNLVGWAGYAEDGSTDPKVDWVSDFEKQDRLSGQLQGRQHLRRDGRS